jgi:hypothetical protein
MNKSREDKNEYLLNEERKASECVTENLDGKDEKSKRMVMYLKYFDPETNSYSVKAVQKQNKSISNPSSLNSLNK